MNRTIIPLLTLVFLSFNSCVDEETIISCAIEGRCNIIGLDNTIYEFHDGLRYSKYTDNKGQFGTRSEAIPNPLNYSYFRNTLIIDINFGNITEARPDFKCDCQVVVLESSGTMWFRENFNTDSCP